jgi:hypothetical protein
MRLINRPRLLFKANLLFFHAKGPRQASGRSPHGAPTLRHTVSQTRRNAGSAADDRRNSHRFFPLSGVPQAVHQRRRKPPVGVKKQKDGKREQAGLGEAWKKLSLEHDTRDRTPCWSTLRRRVQLRRLSHEGAARAPANRKGCALTPPARFDQPVPFGRCAFVCQEPRRAGATRRWRPTPASACCRAGLVRASSSARRKVG